MLTHTGIKKKRKFLTTHLRVNPTRLLWRHLNLSPLCFTFSCLKVSKYKLFRKQLKFHIFSEKNELDRKWDAYDFLNFLWAYNLRESFEKKNKIFQQLFTKENERKTILAAFWLQTKSSFWMFVPVFVCKMEIIIEMEIKIDEDLTFLKYSNLHKKNFLWFWLECFIFSWNLENIEDIPLWTIKISNNEFYKTEARCRPLKYYILCLAFLKT